LEGQCWKPVVLWETKFIGEKRVKEQRKFTRGVVSELCRRHDGAKDGKTQGEKTNETQKDRKVL